MKKRSILLFTLVLALVVSLSVGCGSKTPKEILEDAIMNSSKIKSSQQKVELDFSLDMETDDPMVAGFLQMLEDISVVMEIKADSENMKSQSDITVDLSGMAYTVELFVTPDEVAFSIPLLPQYVVQELDQEQQMNDEAKKEMSALVEEFTRVMLENVNDEKIINNGSKNITTAEGDVKVTEIAVEMSDEEIKTMLEKVVDIMFENPQMRGYLIQSFKTSLEAEGQEMTDEELEESIDEMKDEMTVVFEEMNEVLEISDLNMTYFIDNNSNIRKTDFQFSINIEDEELGEAITMEFNGTSEMWNLNKELDIEIPEFNEENSITMEEFMNQMFGLIPYN